MTNFLELLQSAGGRATLAGAATIDRATRMLSALFKPRGRRIPPPPDSVLNNNHFRRDIGLPPIDSRGWRL